MKLEKIDAAARQQRRRAVLGKGKIGEVHANVRHDRAGGRAQQLAVRLQDRDFNKLAARKPTALPWSEART